MKNETSIPIIDCDIHPQPSDEFPLQPFIDEKFHQAVAQGQGSQPGAGYANPFGVNRRDAECKNPHHVARDLFDRYNIVYGVLQPGGLHVSLTHNIDVGTALARAWNEWQIANFLKADERFLGSVCINTNDPVEAAKEVRRAGQHPQMVQVIVCGESTHLYGHRSYFPIYEACEEMKLPFAMHPGFEGARTPSTPVGAPSSYFEWHVTIPLTYQAHVASFLCEGVFEKFPSLKVMLVEGGIGWLPSLLWRMDKDYKALRSTTPWLKHLPSDYALEHIRLSSQPLEEPPRQEQLLQLFEMMNAERTLCFASDFPHWDFDDPLRAFPHRMSVELKQRILYENAAELYGLPSLEEKRAATQASQQVEYSVHG
jgi:predicted TIM-barrel fold metal-dependent hydrolase